MAKIKLKIAPIHRKIILGVAVVILIAIVGTIVWIKVISTSEDNGAAPLQTAEEVQIEAAGYFDANDVDGGLRYYDEKVDSKEDDNDKRELLLYKSSFALMAGRHDAGIDAAKKADAIGSSPETLRTLAEAYAASGDKAQALIYYKKLIAILPPDISDGISRGPSLEEIVRGLEQ